MESEPQTTPAAAAAEGPELRPFRADDARVVFGLLRAAQARDGSRVGRPTWHDDAAVLADYRLTGVDPATALRVAEHDGRIIAFAGYNRAPWDPDAWLCGPVVAPEARHAGRGASLLQWAVSAARDGGATGVRAQTAAANAEARALLESAGFAYRAPVQRLRAARNEFRPAPSRRDLAVRRVFDPAGARAAWAVHREVLPDLPCSEEAFAYWAAHPSFHLLFFAEAAGRPAGTVLVDDDGSGEVWLRRLAVRPEARDGGIAHALLSRALSLTLLRNTIFGVSVEVDVEDLQALDLYAELGFRLHAVLEEYRLAL